MTKIGKKMTIIGPKKVLFGLMRIGVFIFVQLFSG